MKRISKFFALAIVMLAFTAATYAQTATADALATIVAPMTITHSTDLVFGNIIGTVAGGSVTIAADAAGTRSGTAALIVNTSLATSSAQFAVTGSANSHYTITLPVGAVTLTDAAGANPMSVITWVSSPDDATNPTIPVAGNFTLYVGATLTVPGNQPAGSYSTSNPSGTGPFTVGVNYE
jgi:hypothetical protein